MTAAADLVWKALSDPTRRAILDVLATGPKSTGELCIHVAPGWPANSALRCASLVYR